MIRDSVSNLIMGDPAALPRLLGEKPDSKALQRAFDSMILSASGWRKVFVAGGDEENQSPEVEAADLMIAGMVAHSLADFLVPALEKAPQEITVALGMDSRPTGTLLADAFIRVAMARGIGIHYLFIAAAPEVMSYARSEERLDAFAYISASHNPIGHNGFKFGMKTGGVLDAESAGELGAIFRHHIGSPASHDSVYHMLQNAEPDALSETFRQKEIYKPASLSAYRDFSEIVLADSFEEKQRNLRLEELRQACAKRPIGILGELNGSARSLSIDREFLESLGVKVRLIHNQPRKIIHRIVPEGRSLNMCRDELQALHAADPDFIIGYVPDNDGDRGNLVYMAGEARAEILEAQTVFALVALAECAWLEYSGQLHDGKKVAVAVNGPTSMRIDEICRSFGVSCFRAEVGEANVVGLAEDLRDRGYLVRLMGEGSNGGNITYPAAVRDPINTLGSIVKLMSLRSDVMRKGLFHIWCERRNIPYNDNFTFADVLDSLPRYVSTSAYEDRALMSIKSLDHGNLKTAYERLFVVEVEQRLPELTSRWGIVSWEEINTEGGREIRGFGPDFRSGKQKGGFKILFSNAAGDAQAYIWMRGSGTEPVFRVLADVKGSRPELEQYLLDWHRSLIERADLNAQK